MAGQKVSSRHISAKWADYPAVFLRPFRKTLDFSGRSRGTEVGLYLFLSNAYVALLAQLVFLTASALGIGIDGNLVGLVTNAAILLPMPALFTRRAHDTGRNWLWALPGYLMCPLAGYVSWLNYRHGLPAVANMNILGWQGLILAIVIFSYCLIAIFAPKDETGKYGPDPRTQRA